MPRNKSNDSFSTKVQHPAIQNQILQSTMNTIHTNKSSIPTNSTGAYIPLTALFVSLNNVRKKAPSGIEELAAMIEAQGLLHPLHVTAETDGSIPTGRYGVEAGGRRLVALQLLSSQGRIDPNSAIECRVVDEAQALQISLTENISQEGMHPADEFEAYKSLGKEGNSIDEIAAKFGVTTVHVQRRLKMANVAPMLIDLYRNNVITLDHIMAFASTDDHARQVLVWNGLAAYSRTAGQIKRALNETEVPVNNIRVRMVGLDVYLKAGGDMRTDLFSEDNSQFITDPVLLDTLVNDRISHEQDLATAQGWSWVKFEENLGYSNRFAYIFPQRTTLADTPESDAELLVLEQTKDEVDDKISLLSEQEDGSWDEIQRLEKLSSDLEQAIEEFHEKRMVDGVYDKATTGAVICFEKDSFVIHTGVIRKPEQNNGTSGSTGSQQTATKSRSEVPEKLLMNLSSQRTAAIQALMVKNQNVALAALAAKMAQSMFYKPGQSPVKINFMECRSTLKRNSPTLVNSPALAEIEAAHQKWENTLPKNSSTWMEWFLSQPEATSIEMIVFGTANSVDAIQTDLTRSDTAKPLADALLLDMADWWTATPESYLDLVPKAKLIDAVNEAVGSKAAVEMVKMKKVEAVAYASEQLKGHRWLPVGLRVVAAVVPDKNSVVADDADDADDHQGDDIDGDMSE